MTIKIRHIKGHHWFDFRSYLIHMHGTILTSILFLAMLISMFTTIFYAAAFIFRIR